MNKIYKVIGNIDDDSTTPYHSYPIGTLVIRIDNVVAFDDGPYASYNVSEIGFPDHRQQVSITDLEEVQ